MTNSKQRGLVRDDKAAMKASRTLPEARKMKAEAIDKASPGAG
jgi:hypothetical protein